MHGYWVGICEKLLCYIRPHVLLNKHAVSAPQLICNSEFTTMLSTAAIIVPDIKWNDTFGGVVSGVVDDRRYWMPVQAIHRVQKV